MQNIISDKHMQKRLNIGVANLRDKEIKETEYRAMGISEHEEH